MGFLAHYEVFVEVEYWFLIGFWEFSTKKYTYFTIYFAKQGGLCKVWHCNGVNVNE